MLSHNSQESLPNNSTKLKLVWYRDGFGIENGTNTYTIRASNFILNSQRIAGFTASTLAFMASSLPQVFGVERHNFQVKDTNYQFFVWPWHNGNDLGIKLLNMLSNGACNVLTSDSYKSYVPPYCVQMKTSEGLWVFATDPLEGTTCENLYKVSRCIADLAMQYGNQSSTIFPESDPSITTTAMPPPPTNSNDGDAVTPLTFGLISVASICALGTLSFFGRKLYKKYTANSGYMPIPINNSSADVEEKKEGQKTFSCNHLDPSNYECPVHLDLMEDPQELHPCGHNLDFISVQGLQPNDEGNCSCPLCRTIINDYKPNNELKTAIQEYKNNRDIAISISNETNEDANATPKMIM